MLSARAFVHIKAVHNHVDEIDPSSKKDVDFEINKSYLQGDGDADLWKSRLVSKFLPDLRIRVHLEIKSNPISSGELLPVGGPSFVSDLCREISNRRFCDFTLVSILINYNQLL